MPRVTKSVYARLKNRAASAVSNWIADGKLRAPALVEDANGDELVDVDLADAMLAAELDPSQQAAQAQPIGAIVQPPAPISATSSDDQADTGAPSEPRVEPEDPDNRRFIRARADVKEAEAEGLRRKRLEETGKWLDAEQARAAFGKEMSASIAEAEAWLLGSLADRLSAELGVEKKAVLPILRREWRAFRDRQAGAKRTTSSSSSSAVPAMAAE